MTKPPPNWLGRALLSFSTSTCGITHYGTAIKNLDGVNAWIRWGSRSRGRLDLTRDPHFRAILIPRVVREQGGETNSGIVRVLDVGWESDRRQMSDGLQGEVLR